MEGVPPDKLLDDIQEYLIPAADNRNHRGVMGNVGTPALPLSGLIEALVSTLELRPISWARVDMPMATGSASIVPVVVMTAVFAASITRQVAHTECHEIKTIC